MYSLRWLLFWSLLGCSLVASLLLTLLQTLVLLGPPPAHQQVALLWQPALSRLADSSTLAPLATLAQGMAGPAGWRISGIAAVDSHAQLSWQQGVFPPVRPEPRSQWQALLPGDVGAQLPIQSRDDLSDALTGAANNGVEQLSDRQFLLISPLAGHADNQPAAVLLALQAPANWQSGIAWWWLQWEFWQRLLLQVVILVPFLLPAGLGLIWLISRRWRQQALHISQIIEKWSVGDFSERLQVKRIDETGQTLLHLNQLADRLQQLLQQRQQWAALQERQQLAATLHDTVKQQLFINNLTLAGCQQQLPPAAPPALASLLQQAISGNQQAFRQVSSLLDQLTEPASSLLLPALLRERIVHTASQHNWQLTLTLPELAVPALLVSAIDEALVNIGKHANASCVSLLLTHQPGQGWYLQVRNNLPMSAATADAALAQPVAGQGLKILSQRLATQGGRLQCSQPDPQQFQLELWLA